MISEATRTIEDSQTAQALHGLLSLKQPEGGSANANEMPSNAIQLRGNSVTQLSPPSQAMQLVRGKWCDFVY